MMGASPNQANTGKFEDVRVRQALSLALDRWGGSQYLPKIALVRTVAGVAYPTHPLAATRDELMRLPPYHPDNDFRRDMARRLLAEAGQSDLRFELHNRVVDQPYKVVGTWLIDQWQKLGLDIEHGVYATGPWFTKLRRERNFEVGLDFNCQSVVNPVVDAAKFISSDRTGNNYASYIDRTLDDWYGQMNRETDFSRRRRIMRDFERRVVWDQAWFVPGFWWYRINPHRSYVKGWKTSPSHYLNQHLDRVWLDR